ncbi:DUF7346 family protein [Halobaculum magnesiiphilum]|uniref:HTH domain protein n=1 Tax=Halobaculum magnesiiphilum TaxID=1017351 RepID=A0A8T8WBX7_9EURY|nr:hypothetical protein [Halobaculum magnesiiphilum]QZP37335.1 hypothetical protein K6T50_13785 [Halobaculum magnesiiphilum]
MQSVRDADGTRYLIVKRSSESSLVRDPATGEERYVPNDDLEPDGESPLSAAADGLPSELRRAVLACRDERALGLLVEFADRGPVSVRTLLDAYDLCESDLHGVLAEFQAAGLLAETTVAGERGYEPTEAALRVVERFRD